MKPLQFIAPVLSIVLAATLVNISLANAQEQAYAYNKVRIISSDEEIPSVIGSFKLNVVRADPETLVFKVTVENPGSEKIVLSIKDANNYTLHQESLPATLVYRARFNMKELQDGNYTFEIRKGKTRLAEQKIDIKTETNINRTVSVE